MADSTPKKELLAPQGHFFTREERAMDNLVAQWVGDEASPDILGRFHPQPRPIATCVEKFLHRIGQDQEMLLDKIRKHWPQMAGEQTSRQIRPVEIRGKTLVISAENQTYLYVLRQSPLMEVIRQRVEQLTGGSVQQCRLISPGRR